MTETEKTSTPPPAEVVEEAKADAFGSLREVWGFPAFAKEFPNDAELARLVRAYADGDYAAVREGAPKLAAKAKDPEVKRAAELLRDRIEPDSSARLLFGLTAALLVFLFVFWVYHDGPKHHAPAPPPTPPVVEIVK